MKPEYEDLHHHADHLFHRLESMIDNHEDELAHELEENGRDVRELLERGRPPRSIEDSLKQLENSLNRLKAAPNAVISPQDAGSLLKDYEDLRRQVRSLPDY